MSVAIPEAPRPAKKASRRWLRVLGTLGMAALFTAGIVYMMMALAGRFEPKVKPIAADSGEASRVPQPRARSRSS